jgi:hypothetical protein
MCLIYKYSEVFQQYANDVHKLLSEKHKTCPEIGLLLPSTLTCKVCQTYSRKEQKLFLTQNLPSDAAYLVQWFPKVFSYCSPVLSAKYSQQSRCFGLHFKMGPKAVPKRRQTTSNISQVTAQKTKPITSKIDGFQTSIKKLGFFF